MNRNSSLTCLFSLETFKQHTEDTYISCCPFEKTTFEKGGKARESSLLNEKAARLEKRKFLFFFCQGAKKEEKKGKQVEI